MISSVNLPVGFDFGPKNATFCLALQLKEKFVKLDKNINFMGMSRF